jgi:acylglycerol lipase
MELLSKVEHREDYFTSNRGLNLYYQAWIPEGDIKAVLMVVHGLAEHSSRYSNIVNHFVPKGYAVYSFDLCGHGKSEGARCYIEQFDDYTADVKTFCSMVREQQGDTRMFLVGHSYGGTIATYYSVRYQSELAGLIVSGATLKIGASVSRILISLSGILSLLVPKMGATVLDASAISRSMDVVEAYVNDPLVFRGKIPVRTGTELIRVIQLLEKEMLKITLPVLIMHGTDDRLSAPEGSTMLYERIGSGDKTLELYQGFYHEIFNEPERNKVLSDMEDWLAGHIS